MVELTLKELKALLDDNDLDLSMRQIASIPIKALRLLPRATNIDLSNNAIRTIPADFCSLVHITKLDLSNNSITQLPHNFGDLVNLTHLDLYRNNIEDLPFSFGNLSALKWLDLKGNPLQSELAKVADACLDAKGCQQAAQQVTKLMRQRTADREHLIEQQRKMLEKFKSKNQQNHEPLIHKEKSKKKRNKHKELANNGIPTVQTTLQNDVHAPLITEDMSEKVAEVVLENPVTTQNERHSFSRRLIRATIKLAILTVVFVSIFSVTNCLLVGRKQWMKGSKSFCNDLHTVLYDFSMPSRIFNNFVNSIISIYEMCAIGVIGFYEYSKENSLFDAIEQYSSPFFKWLTSIWLLLHGYILHFIDDAHQLYMDYASKIVNNAVGEVWLLLRIFALMLADLIILIVDKSLLFTSTAIERVIDFAQHRDSFMRFVESWFRTK